MKKIFATILFLFVVCVNCEVFSAPKYLTTDSKKNVAPNPIFNRTIFVPANQVLTVDISNEVNSSSSNTVDRVDAVLKNDFFYNGKMIAQEDSNLIGMVTKVSKAQKDKPAEIMVKFTNIVTPDGQNIPVSAIIVTPDKSGIIRGENGQPAIIRANSTVDVVIKQPVTFIPLN